MVRQVVVGLSGAFPHRVRQGATANPLNVNLSGLQISLVAADAPPRQLRMGREMKNRAASWPLVLPHAAATGTLLGFICQERQEEPLVSAQGGGGLDSKSPI